jgi:hypothetical protein
MGILTDNLHPFFDRTINPNGFFWSDERNMTNVYAA